MKSNCLLPFYRVKFDADGHFHACCHQLEYYGNIFTDDVTIDNIMKHKKNVDVKNHCLKGSLHSMCNNTRCPVYYNKTNKDVDVQLIKYPREVELSLHPSWCNIGGLKPKPETACFMCPRSDPYMIESIKNTPDRTEEIVEFFKPAMPYLKSLFIVGLSEPFYKGKIIDILEQVEFQKYKEKCQLNTVSNGSVFVEKYQDRLLDLVQNICVAFSVDAIDKDIYYKIRRNHFVPQITKNVKLWFKKLESRPDIIDHSAIAANFSSVNISEIENIVKWASDVGIKRCNFSLTYKTSGNTVFEKRLKNNPNLICNSNNWEVFWEAQLRAEELAKKLDIHLDFIVPFHGGFTKNPTDWNHASGNKVRNQY